MDEETGHDTGRKEPRLTWTLPLRLPNEWRATLEEMAAEMATPTRRKPSLAEVVRECVYQVMIQRGKIEGRRK